MEFITLDDPKPLQGRGFWLHEEKIYEVSKSSHVGFIIDHPQLFNLTEERVREIYDWQNEPLGHEARAREILIRHAVSLGFIRIRHYLRPSDYWSMQMDNTFKRSEQIQNFILWAVDEGILKSHSEAIIMGYDNQCDYHRYRRKSGGIGRYLLEDLKQAVWLLGGSLYPP